MGSISQERPRSASPKQEENPEICIPSPIRLVEIRTGKLKNYNDLSIPTGIYKDARSEVLHIDKVGLPGDEHDLTFHGGPDKAIHQYNTDLYPEWSSIYPEASSRFVPGGFGENLVASGWTERNICIGDKVRIGRSSGLDSQVGGENGALLQVSIPRQPCFKLNQKFKIKNFAPRTHERAWTGWYYRVLQEGDVQAGMELRVIERPNPRWSIERMHHYIHRDKENRQVMEELVEVPELGMETKRPFINRLEKMNAGDDEKKKPEVWRKFRCAEKTQETKRVSAITFELASGEDEATEIDAGSHVRLRLPNGLLRPYSVVEGTTSRFKLGVAREEESRGGSTFLCDEMKKGDMLEVGRISESVHVDSQASHHLIISGGIGITAFLDVMKTMDTINFDYDLHYAVRSTDEIPFRTDLEEKGDRVHLYDSSNGERMDVAHLLKNRKWNSKIYTCGPQRMMDAVAQHSKELAIPPTEIHYENFQLNSEGDPFEAEVVVEGGSKLLHVAEKQTLLGVMRDAGLDVGSSCEVGNCGTCKVRVLMGDVEHKGLLVEKGEMLSCVSRGKGRIRVGLLEE